MAQSKVRRIDIESAHDGLAQLPQRGEVTLISYRADQWPLASNEYSYPGHKHCHSILATKQAKLPNCAEPVVWRKVTRKSRTLTSTGYYCDKHLPAEYRQVAGLQSVDQPTLF